MVFQLLELMYDDRGQVIDYRYLEVNPAFERLTGKTREQVIGHRNKELFSITEDHWLKAYEQVDRTGEPLTYDNYGAELDKFYEIHAWKAGEKKVAMTFSDITERTRAEESLLESEEKFRQIFNHANDAIHLNELTDSGAPGRFIDINEVACHMLGFTREEMLQMQPLDIAVDRHDPSLESVFKGLRTHGWAKFETGHRRKDRVVVPVEINAHVVNIHGKRAIIAVVRDITDRKKVEKALKDSEAKYRGLFENMQEGVILRSLVFDDQGKIVDRALIDANPAALRDLGATSIDDVRGKKDSELLGPEKCGEDAQEHERDEGHGEAHD